MILNRTIYGFNFAIVVALLVVFFGWLVRGVVLAAFLGIALFAVLVGAGNGVVSEPNSYCPDRNAPPRVNYSNLETFPTFYLVSIMPLDGLSCGV